MTAIAQTGTGGRKPCAQLGRLGRDQWKSLGKPGLCRGSPTTFPGIWQPGRKDDRLEFGLMQIIYM